MLVSAQEKALFTDQLKGIIKAALSQDPDTPLPSLGEVPMLRLDETVEVSLDNCILLNIPVVDVDQSTFNGYMPKFEKFVSVTNALATTESRTTNPEDFAALIAEKSFEESLDFLFPTHS